MRSATPGPAPERPATRSATPGPAPERPQSRPPEGPAKVVLDGRFADFPLRDVLAVVAHSRQCMTLELRSEGRPLGRVLIKAGLILDARNADASLVGVPALKSLLSNPGDEFAVVRTETPQGLQPLGRLIDLLAPPRPPPQVERAPEPVVVIEGRFDETPLLELLGVLSVSRSCLELRLPRLNGPTTLVLKAGQVLSVSLPGEPDPVRALAALLVDPGETFTVLRRALPVGARPMGTVQELLTEAQHVSEDLATVVEFPHGGPVDSRDSEEPFEPVYIDSTEDSPTIGLDAPSRPDLVPRADRSVPSLSVVTPTPAEPARPEPSRPEPTRAEPARPVRAEVRAEPPSRPLPALAPAPDPRIDAIVARLDALQLSLSASAPAPVDEALALLGTLEARIAAQDRAIESSARGARTDRLLVLVVLLVQLVTAAAVVVVSLWTMSWNR